MSVSQLCRAWFWLAFTAVGLVAGAMGGVVFIAAFGNVHAGGWSLVSCVPSSAGLHLHYLHKGRRVSLYYRSAESKSTIGLDILYSPLLVLHSCGLMPQGQEPLCLIHSRRVPKCQISI